MSKPRKEIVVLGGGFAGLWAAVGAARKREELGSAADDVSITLVDRNPYHNIRVRNYESDLSDVVVPFDEVLEPIGVRRIEGYVEDIRVEQARVIVNVAGEPTPLTYDRLVFALGSQLVRPSIYGLLEHAFNVDTYAAAQRLNQHLQSLADTPDHPERFTVLVVGAGLTGIETATEMVTRLKALADRAGGNQAPRVILADRASHVGSDMGDSARPVIEEALRSLGIEVRLGVDIVEVDPQGVHLRDGERIAASTVVWCAGMRANPTAGMLGVPLDECGRVEVDAYLRVKGVNRVFAAGDVAWMLIDGEHRTVMSCQHARPMGRFAGHNAICDLLGLPMLPLQIDWYATVLDLGAAGAVQTMGFDRHVIAQGEEAKRVKQEINRRRIYPPRTSDPATILAAAAPVVQAPPKASLEGDP